MYEIFSRHCEAEGENIFRVNRGCQRDGKFVIHLNKFEIEIRQTCRDWVLIQSFDGRL